MSSKTVQVTIWSDRRHCEDEVLRSLRFLSPPRDGELHRLWLVHGSEQLTRLMDKAQGLKIQWVRLAGLTVPQYCADRAAKKSACLESFNAALEALEGRQGDEDAFLVEDDITMPGDALMVLCATAMASEAAAVTGLARDVAGDWPIRRHVDNQRLTDRDLGDCLTPFKVRSTGTFCLLLTADLLRRMRDEHYRAVQSMSRDAYGHDLHLCDWLHQRNLRLMLDPKVRCDHHVEVKPGHVVIQKT